MEGVYKNIEDYNLNKKEKLLIVLDEMIADMVSNKKLNSIVTESFIRGRKLSISLVFISQSYFLFPLNSTHYDNKLHLIIHLTLKFNTLLILIKSELQNHILFRLLILLLLWIILHVLESIS